MEHDVNLISIKATARDLADAAYLEYWAQPDSKDVHRKQMMAEFDRLKDLIAELMEAEQ